MAQSKKNQIATGQKNGVVSTFLTPAMRAICLGGVLGVPAGEGHPIIAGRSRTIKYTSTANTTVMIPTRMNDCRQPIRLLTQTSGVAAIREPTPPKAMRIPVMVANSLIWNHSARIFMVGTKSMATPSPTKVLPTMARDTEGARPRMTDPINATIKKRVMVFRGPQESDKSPAGNCMAAYG